MASRRSRVAVTAAALVLVGPVFVPEALAFPYHRIVRGASIWSEAPIPPAIDGVVARADALVATSPLAIVPSGRRVFLTAGGWRWRWLSLPRSGAFGLTRLLSEAVIVNRSDVAADRVSNGAMIGGTRSLSGVLAHERVHTLMRARYGLVTAMTLPLWLGEGYPDYVARESSLSDAQAAAVRRAGGSRALAYYDGRRRVAAALASGATVDGLVASARR